MEEIEEAGIQGKVVGRSFGQPPNSSASHLPMAVVAQRKQPSGFVIEADLVVDDSSSAENLAGVEGPNGASGASGAAGRKGNEESDRIQGFILGPESVRMSAGEGSKVQQFWGPGMRPPTVAEQRLAEENLGGVQHHRMEEGWFEMISALKNVSKPWGDWWPTLVYLFDMGQPLRVVSSGAYGWRPRVAKVMRHTDLCFVLIRYIFDLFAPSFFYFAFAATVCIIMVSLALMCSVIMFRIKHQDPGAQAPYILLTTLRLVVGFNVKTFFVATLQWIIAPIDCRNWKNSMASLIQDKEDGCEPWESPLVFVSVALILLGAFHACFALGISIMFVEPDPTKRPAGKKNSVVTEFVWVCTKVLITVGGKIAEHISSPVMCFLLLVLQTIVISLHNTRLPHQSPWLNKVRGGIFAAVGWQCVGGVVSGIGGANSSRDTKEVMQMILCCFCPLAFLGGYWWVHHSYSEIKTKLEYLEKDHQCSRAGSLRAEVSKQKQGRILGSGFGACSGEEEAGNPGSQGTPLPLGSSGPGGNPGVELDGCSLGVSVLVESDAEDKEMLKFWSPYSVISLVVYYLRQTGEQRDGRFIDYIMDLAKKQYPESLRLKLFQIQVDQYVHGEIRYHKYGKLVGWLPPDQRYILYAMGVMATPNKHGRSFILVERGPSAYQQG